MRCLPVNLNAVLVELADLEETLALFDALRAEPIEGVTEMVPAARTILIHFDPSLCAAESLPAQLALRQGGRREHADSEIVHLPVRYDGDDLPDVAACLGMTVDEVVSRHTKTIWQVAFTGFAPGFPYMTGDDPAFDVPRRNSPRTQIPAGSVGLAGRFCGIYPRATPGGWQLLGVTEVPMWDLSRTPAALLQPGQRVQFVDVATEAGQQLLARWRAGSIPGEEDGYSADDTRRKAEFDAVSEGVSANAAGTVCRKSDTQRDSANAASLAENGDREKSKPIPALAPTLTPTPETPETPTPPAAGHAPLAGEVFEVISTGLQTLFQDLGRAGQAGQGVSESGALDRGAFLAANRLVGNARNSPALELLHGGFSVRVLAPAVVAVTGAAGPLSLRHADGSQLKPERQRAFSLEAGDVLSVGAPEDGLRSYLAVRGGFEVTPVLGSCATDTLSGIGPDPVQAGQRLRVGRQIAGTVETEVRPVVNLPGLNSDSGTQGRVADSGQPLVTLDLVLGPRTDWFDDESIQRLQSQVWQVTQQSNRVGLRLLGDQPLQRASAFAGVELASEGTATGALQVPGNGQPVLFLADHPLTGGYPVIGCVAPHHLDLAAQLPAGTMLRFRVLAPFAEIRAKDA